LNPANHPPRLTVTTEPDKGFHAEFDLVGDSLSFGRANDNALHVPLAIISRHHAVITRLNNETQVPSYKIVQYNSINPLRYQGQRIAEKVLEDGDIIEIGDRKFAEYIVKLTYHIPQSD
jgi:pSer/pThr/pTyr-binding forkhead associated (FHA) protein